MSKSTSTFLMTAKATVTDMNDNYSKKVRVLLDLGSQRSFITREIADAVQLPVIGKEKMIVNGFGQTGETIQKFEVVEAKLWNSQTYEYKNIELHVVPFICSPLSNQKINLARKTYENLMNLPLADWDDEMKELKFSQCQLEMSQAAKQVKNQSSHTPHLGCNS